MTYIVLWASLRRSHTLTRARVAGLQEAGDGNVTNWRQEGRGPSGRPARLACYGTNRTAKNAYVNKERLSSPGGQTRQWALGGRVGVAGYLPPTPILSRPYPATHAQALPPFPAIYAHILLAG